ncbi:TetR family transcriptional regulator [Pseudonocardia pini]|uniref:TetR family transcriptional regulator n=1 Tax=Pseudonocardia pini TaxID=2758030 RepID=UPI0015F03150|nr:TetR family transcriptional regulator [Pseudonocardia pini]
MALSREQVVAGAYAVLQEQGLSGLSMRRVAQGLGVQPGALYYHVPSKQEMLAEIAARILDGVPGPTTDPRQAARELRAALLRARDGAEVVSFVHAFRPDALPALQQLPTLFAGLRPREAGWAARAVVHYVLGFVAEEQNRAELVRLEILAAGPADADEAFEFGIAALTRRPTRPA